MVEDAEDPDDNYNDVISSVLKTGSSRLAELQRDVQETFKADDNTFVPSEVAPTIKATGTTPKGPETDPPTDAAQS